MAVMAISKKVFQIDHEFEIVTEFYATINYTII